MEYSFQIYDLNDTIYLLQGTGEFMWHAAP